MSIVRLQWKKTKARGWKTKRGGYLIIPLGAGTGVPGHMGWELRCNGEVCSLNGRAIFQNLARVKAFAQTHWEGRLCHVCRYRVFPEPGEHTCDDCWDQAIAGA